MYRGTEERKYYRISNIMEEVEYYGNDCGQGTQCKEYTSTLPGTMKAMT